MLPEPDGAANKPLPEPGGFLERYFHLRERGTTPRVEILGGLTTFATMAYIIVANPAILRFADIPQGPSTVATILTIVFGTLLMGLYANRPIAVAPYMGENAFIAFSLSQFVVGITFQMRLGTVFIAGIVFLVLTLLKLRTWLSNSISLSLKHSFAVGIGLFLMLVGMYLTGIVTSDITGLPPDALRTANGLLLPPPKPLKIGDFTDRKVLLAIAGFVLTAALMIRKVRGAILIGIVATAFGGFAVGVGKAPEQVMALPFVGKYDLGEIAFQLDIKNCLTLAFLPILLTLVLISFLDTLGTLIGVADAGEMLDDKGNLPEIEKPMLVDALSCVFGGLVGTSTSGAYIESATGIREGARTGLAAVTTALLFALTLFFIPLFEPLQDQPYVYGPALMAVGVLMIQSVRKVDFDDWTEAVPAVATIAMILFTYNIANGLTAGLILYPTLKLLTGRWRDLNSGSIALGLLSLVYYVFGKPH